MSPTLLNAQVVVIDMTIVLVDITVELGTAESDAVVSCCAGGVRNNGTRSKWGRPRMSHTATRSHHGCIIQQTASHQACCSLLQPRGK